jgi:hypothetical protein
MSALRQSTLEYINKLPEDKLGSAFDFIKYLYEQDYQEQDSPLDEYDYELAKQADEEDDKTFVDFDELLKKFGFTREDLND